MITCQTLQMLEALAEDKKINAIGFTNNGRKILDDQEHIFVEAFTEMEVLSMEQKLEQLKQKLFNKGK